MGSPTALHTKRYRAFLSRLRLAREESGLTQEQVAEALDRTQTWVSNSELGERRVDFVELEDFAGLYGKPLEWFGTKPAGLDGQALRPAKRSQPRKVGKAR